MEVDDLDNPFSRRLKVHFVKLIFMLPGVKQNEKQTLV